MATLLISFTTTGIQTQLTIPDGNTVGLGGEWIDEDLDPNPPPSTPPSLPGLTHIDNFTEYYDYGSGISYWYTQGAHTEVNMYVGSQQYGTPDHLIVLQVTAWEYLWDVDEQKWLWGSEIPPANISIAGRGLNCNGIVHFIIGANSGTLDFTPTVSGYDSYIYTVHKRPTSSWARTKAHHPLLEDALSASALQEEFNLASESVLLADADGCVPDDDPRLNDDKFWRADDVPAYVEFFIVAANPETFPPEYSGNEYNEIPNTTRRDQLLAAPFSQIKLVTSLPGEAGVEWGGYIIYAQPFISATLLMHEYGHAQGLTHRGVGGNVDVNAWMQEQNPDKEAVMYGEYGWSGTEINRYEKAFFE